jgi:hypothetical protein
MRALSLSPRSSDERRRLPSRTIRIRSTSTSAGSRAATRPPRFQLGAASIAVSPYIPASAPTKGAVRSSKLSTPFRARIRISPIGVRVSSAMASSRRAMYSLPARRLNLRSRERIVSQRTRRCEARCPRPISMRAPMLCMIRFGLSATAQSGATSTAMTRKSACARCNALRRQSRFSSLTRAASSLSRFNLSETRSWTSRGHRNAASRLRSGVRAACRLGTRTICLGVASADGSVRHSNRFLK